LSVLNTYPYIVLWLDGFVSPAVPSTFRNGLLSRIPKLFILKSCLLKPDYAYVLVAAVVVDIKSTKAAAATIAIFGPVWKVITFK
jgi:hypothetical protein